MILSRVIKTFRLAEAKVDEMVAHMSRLSNPTLATYVSLDGVQVRITAKAKDKTEAQRLIAQSEEELRSILSPYVWGVDDDTLASAVGNLLTARSWSLATMESCTEGLLCSAIAGGTESCRCFEGALLACSAQAKVACGVDASVIARYGDEGIQVTRAMAEIARANLKADIGMGVGGNLAPNSNSGEAFVSVRSDTFDQTFTHRLRGDRSRMKQRAVYAALFDLRRMLLEEVKCT